MVTQFQYLARTIEHKYNDCPEANRNIGNLRAVWSSLGKLLRREGADNRVLDLLYRALIQEALLFG